jgi:hypothetical protein
MGRWFCGSRSPTGSQSRHRHSKDEFVTVISGTFAVAAGEELD